MITLITPSTITYLPNPQFGDSESQVHTVEFKKSMNNTRYTYVKSRAARRKLSLRFDLTLAKAFELMEFIRKYQSTQITLRDHLEQVWRGYITTNPNEVESQAKAIRNSTSAFGHGNIQIEFEGSIQ
jgi:hypothetical protein